MTSTDNSSLYLPKCFIHEKNVSNVCVDKILNSLASHFKSDETLPNSIKPSSEKSKEKKKLKFELYQILLSHRKDSSTWEQNNLSSVDRITWLACQKLAKGKVKEAKAIDMCLSRLESKGGIKRGSSVDSALSLIFLLANSHKNSSTSQCYKSSLLHGVPKASIHAFNQRIINTFSLSYPDHNSSCLPENTHYSHQMFSEDNLADFESCDQALYSGPKFNYFMAKSKHKNEQIICANSLEDNISDQSQRNTNTRNSCEPENISIESETYNNLRKKRNLKSSKLRTKSWFDLCNALPGCGISSLLFAEDETNAEDRCLGASVSTLSSKEFCPFSTRLSVPPLPDSTSQPAILFPSQYFKESDFKVSSSSLGTSDEGYDSSVGSESQSHCNESTESLRYYSILAQDKTQIWETVAKDKTDKSKQVRKTWRDYQMLNMKKKFNFDCYDMSEVVKSLPPVIETGAKATHMVWYILMERWSSICQGVTLPHLSVIPQHLLCQHLVYSLVGIPSHSFILHKGNDSFSPLPGVCYEGVSPEAVGSILVLYSSAATSFRRIEQMCDNYFSEGSSDDAIVFSFMHSLRELLNHFRGEVFQHHSEKLFLALHFKIHTLRTQIEFLGEVCGVKGRNVTDVFSKDGMELIGELLFRLQLPCPEGCAPILLLLIEAAVTPFFRIIERWVFGGVPHSSIVTIDNEAVKRRDNRYMSHAFSLPPACTEGKLPPLFGEVMHLALRAGTALCLLSLCDSHHPLLSLQPHPPLSLCVTIQALTDVKERTAIYTHMVEEILSNQKKELQRGIESKRELLKERKASATFAREKAERERQVAIQSRLSSKREEQLAYRRSIEEAAAASADHKRRRAEEEEQRQRHIEEQYSQRSYSEQQNMSDMRSVVEKFYRQLAVVTDNREAKVETTGMSAGTVTEDDKAISDLTLCKDTTESVSDMSLTSDHVKSTAMTPSDILRLPELPLEDGEKRVTSAVIDITDAENGQKDVDDNKNNNDINVRDTFDVCRDDTNGNEIRKNNSNEDNLHGNEDMEDEIRSEDENANKESENVNKNDENANNENLNETKEYENATKEDLNANKKIENENKEERNLNKGNLNKGEIITNDRQKSMELNLVNSNNVSGGYSSMKIASKLLSSSERITPSDKLTSLAPLSDFSPLPQYDLNFGASFNDSVPLRDIMGSALRGTPTRGATPVSSSCDITLGEEAAPPIGSSESSVAKALLSFSSSDIVLSSVPIFLVRSLSSAINSQVSSVEQSVVLSLSRHHGLLSHLSAVKQWLLMQNASFSSSLLRSLMHYQHSLLKPSAVLTPVVLNSALSEALGEARASTPSGELSFVLTGEQPLAFNHINVVPSCVSLQYKVPWPCSLVITPDKLSLLSKLSTFLMTVNAALHSIDSVFTRLKLIGRHHGRGLTGSFQYHSVCLFRHQISHFVRVLYEYFMRQIVLVCGPVYPEGVDPMIGEASSLSQLNTNLSVSVSSVLRRCFLSPSNAPVLSIVRQCLSLVHLFEAQLSAHHWKKQTDDSAFTHGAYSALKETHSTFTKKSAFLSKLLHRVQEIHPVQYIDELLSGLDYNNQNI